MVSNVRGDQCQYGQEVQYGEHRGQPVRKSTGFMGNAQRILERFVHASGRVATDAARYGDGLCRAMIRGMMGEMQSRGIWRPGEVETCFR